MLHIDSTFRLLQTHPTLTLSSSTQQKKKHLVKFRSSSTHLPNLDAHLPHAPAFLGFPETSRTFCHSRRQPAEAPSISSGPGAMAVRARGPLKGSSQRMFLSHVQREEPEEPAENKASEKQRKKLKRITFCQSKVSLLRKLLRLGIQGALWRLLRFALKGFRKRKLQSETDGGLSNCMCPCFL